MGKSFIDRDVDLSKTFIIFEALCCDSYLKKYGADERLSFRLISGNGRLFLLMAANVEAHQGARDRDWIVALFEWSLINAALPYETCSQVRAPLINLITLDRSHL